MTTASTTLDELDRETLLAVAHELMLLGMIANRGMLPQVVLHTGEFDSMNEVAIDLWMGASPVYTHRLRSLLGIEGDGVDAIMKALQFDNGFVHQYMDVAYRVHDEHDAEFWLNHCGALIDAEEHGDERVFGMCHTIEDPTFDATALATNPRARIRPIHRPPRTPVDRHPHCHWTLKIDPANEPITTFPITEEVKALAGSTVPNERRAPVGDGMEDYSGAFVPTAKLPDLDSSTLAAVTREFIVQAQLLTAAAQLTMAERWGADVAHTMIVQSWLASAAISAERLAPLVTGVHPTETRPTEPRPTETMAAVLAVTGAIPHGYRRDITIDGDTVRVELTSEHPGLDDPGHPGWIGLCAAGEPAGFVGTAFGVDRRSRVEVTTPERGRVLVDITIDPDAAEAPEPDAVALMRVGKLWEWHFDLGTPVEL
ncbi:MAG: hypothetical protein RIB98_01080 [Acidimicrobiales bacterium]